MSVSAREQKGRRILPVIVRGLCQKISYSIRTIVQMFAGDEEPGRYADHGIEIKGARLVEGDEVEKVVEGHGGGCDLTPSRCLGNYLRGGLACVLLLHAGCANLEMTSARAAWGKGMNGADILTSGALLRKGLLAVGGDIEGMGGGTGGGGDWGTG